MNNQTREPIAWQNFDASCLPTLLLHDTWTTDVGIALLCDIEPKSVGLHGDFEYRRAPYTVVKILSLPNDLVFDLTSFEKERNSFVEDREEDDEDQETFFFHRMSGRIEQNVALIDVYDYAYKCELAFRRNKAIFESHPEYALGARFSPQHFVGWAVSKDLKVPWLEWAHARGYLDAPEQAAINDKPQEPNTTARNTYLVVIAALLKQMGIDYSKLLANRGKTSLAQEIEGYTANIDARITHKTISTQVLDLIEDAVEARHK